ncbi:hypothetical protein THAOC_36928 [Thalassiosira oceanica]|uniref:Uncharacterized protein n=1 Tax=Thalassiosira oceanica TaxID=159749 RepID=K0R740_THAOC|nr:hypothetical protein THAOC_36928 [Thalassiosira oceanica]|eukprot:EJK44521.1 hypothetical protein THAOC_36928 [Thalassiosira oceanica]
MYTATLITFLKNKTKAASLRNRNEPKLYGKKVNGIATSRSFPVLDGEQHDIKYFTEEFLNAVSSLETDHWVPNNITNTTRFVTVRDLCKDHSPLKEAVNRVIDRDYPNANQQTNNAVPNLVKKAVFELTKQANAGEKRESS